MRGEGNVKGMGSNRMGNIGNGQHREWAVYEIGRSGSGQAGELTDWGMGGSENGQ